MQLKFQFLIDRYTKLLQTCSNQVDAEREQGKLHVDSNDPMF